MRGSDFVTSLSVSGGSVINGDNPGDAVEVTGRDCMLIGTFAQDSTETLSIRLEFAAAETGATWHRLRDEVAPASTELGPSTITAAHSPFAFSVNAFSTGENYGIAAPWVRAVGVIGTAAPGAGTSIVLKLAFSGPMR